MNSTSVLAVGLAEEMQLLHSMVGWGERGSWGYHSDDGNVIVRDEPVGDPGPGFDAGQTVGVAVDGERKAAWFTLDGNRVGEL